MAVAGHDLPAAIGGAVLLTAVLTSYSHFLGPVGLPDLPLRVFQQQAPGATAHWLGYRQEVLIAAPITLLVSLAGLLVLARRQWRDRRPTRTGLAALVAGMILLVAVGALIAPRVGPDADRAHVSATGSAAVEHGPWFAGTTPASADLTLAAVNRNRRVTPLPPHDTVTLTATVRHPAGHVYTVEADRPLVDDRAGRYTTWWGVGLDVWHHGRSGIGTSRVPATHAPAAVFALGTVNRDGSPVAAGVPVHVMTMADGKAELDVGDPDGPSVAGVPDGHLRAT